MRFFASLISKILMAKIRKTIIKSKFSLHFFCVAQAIKPESPQNSPPTKTKNRLKPLRFKAIIIKSISLKEN